VRSDTGGPKANAKRLAKANVQRELLVSELYSLRRGSPPPRPPVFDDLDEDERGGLDPECNCKACLTRLDALEQTVSRLDALVRSALGDLAAAGSLHRQLVESRALHRRVVKLERAVRCFDAIVSSAG